MRATCRVLRMAVTRNLYCCQKRQQRGSSKSHDKRWCALLPMLPGLGNSGKAIHSCAAALGACRRHCVAEAAPAGCGHAPSPAPAGARRPAAQPRPWGTPGTRGGRAGPARPPECAGPPRAPGTTMGALLASSPRAERHALVGGPQSKGTAFPLAALSVSWRAPHLPKLRYQTTCQVHWLTMVQSVPCNMTSVRRASRHASLFSPHSHT